MKRQLIYGVVVGLPSLVLFLVATTVGMTFALNSNVADLAKHAREAIRAEKSLRIELASVRDELAALEKAPANAADLPEPVAEPAAAPVAQPSPIAVRSTAVAPVKVAASSSRVAVVSPGLGSIVATPTPECKFHSGDSAGLMDCIHQQQDRIGGAPPRTLYR
jgi:hypothetical protein